MPISIAAFDDEILRAFDKNINQEDHGDSKGQEEDGLIGLMETAAKARPARKVNKVTPLAIDKLKQDPDDIQLQIGRQEVCTFDLLIRTYS